MATEFSARLRYFMLVYEAVSDLFYVLCLVIPGQVLRGRCSRCCVQILPLLSLSSCQISQHDAMGTFAAIRSDMHVRQRRHYGAVSRRRSRCREWRPPRAERGAVNMFACNRPHRSGAGGGGGHSSIVCAVSSLVAGTLL